MLRHSYDKSHNSTNGELTTDLRSTSDNLRTNLKIFCKSGTWSQGDCLNESNHWRFPILSFHAGSNVGLATPLLKPYQFINDALLTTRLESLITATKSRKVLLFVLITNSLLHMASAAPLSLHMSFHFLYSIYFCNKLCAV